MSAIKRIAPLITPTIENGRQLVNACAGSPCWNKPKVDRPELIPVDRPIPADRPQLIQEDRPEKECKKPECRSHSGIERNVMNRKIRSRLEKDFE